MRGGVCVRPADAGASGNGKLQPDSRGGLPLVLPKAAESLPREIRQGRALRRYAQEPAGAGCARSGEVQMGKALDVYAVNVNGSGTRWRQRRRHGIHSSIGPVADRADHQKRGQPRSAAHGRRENGYPGAVYNDERYLKLLTEAKKYIGYPYVGRIDAGNVVDCSGYVCWTLNQSGMYETERTDAQGLC